MNQEQLHQTTSLTHWLEALHGLAGKLGSDGVRGEGLVEVDECSCRGDIPPVEQVIELRNGETL